MSRDERPDKADFLDRRKVLLGLGALGTMTVAGASRATASSITYDGVLLDQGGATYNVRSAAFGATGNGVDDDTTAVQAAVDAAAAAFGVVLLPPGRYAISDRINIPQGVDMVGAGNGEGHSGTRFVCTTASAGLSFGTRTTGGRGGISGAFLVDGNNIATNPLFVGLTVERTFINVEAAFASPGDAGWRLEGTQNCLFLGCNVAHCGGVGMEIDYGAAGNLFTRCEFDDCGIGLVVRQTTPGTHNNGFNHCLFERSGSGNVRQYDSSWCNFKDCLFQHDGIAGVENVRCDSGALDIDSCYFTGTGAGTAITCSGNAAFVAVSGMTTINAHAIGFWVDGGRIELGEGVRLLSTPTYAGGARGQNAVIRGRRLSPVEITRRDRLDYLLLGRVDNDTGVRFWIDASGGLSWAPGTGYTAESSLGYWGSNRVVLSAASLLVATPGHGLRVAEGANAKQGVVTLTTGTAIVANTSVSTGSRIMLTAQDDSVKGALRVASRVSGVSFTIKSSSILDSGLVAYQIFEPA